MVNETDIYPAAELGRLADAIGNIQSTRIILCCYNRCRSDKLMFGDLRKEVGEAIDKVCKMEGVTIRPCMVTYQKLLNILNADMVIHKVTKTVQEKCVVKAQEILLISTETQAMFMTNVLEAMAQNIELVT